MGKGGTARKEKEEEGEEKKERGRFLSLSLPTDVAATRIRLISAADVDTTRQQPSEI